MDRQSLTQSPTEITSKDCPPVDQREQSWMTVVISGQINDNDLVKGLMTVVLFLLLELLENIELKKIELHI